MPKKNHRRGGAGENKHIGGFDEVKRRNENDGKDIPKGKGKGKAEDEWESSSGDEEPELPKGVKPKKKEKGEGGEEPPKVAPKPKKEKAAGSDDEVAPIGAQGPSGGGMELSRKQREEMQKEAARRRYEELHKAGKTDEAKADLGRLAEVKKRREEAAKAKAEAEAAEKEKKAGKSKDVQAKAEMKELLGGEAAKLRGSRSSIKKQESGVQEPGVEVGGEAPGDGLHKRGVEPASLYTQFRVEGTEAPKKNTANAGKVKDGSILACREAEDDFM